MMTWSIAILPNDCPLLFKRAIHCPSTEQCTRLLSFVCLFVVVICLFGCFVFLWMYVVGVLFCFCMRIPV